MKILLALLAAVFTVTGAHAASYGPYPIETYQTCGASSAPVAVEIVHGGDWSGGDGGTSQEASLCRYLGANGVYAIAVNYRLSTTAPWPAQLQDVQLGLRYLRAISIAKRVGVIGVSAGAHMALSMGEASGTVKYSATDFMGEASILPGFSDKPDFVVDISGPTDLTDSTLLPAGVARLIRGIAMPPLAARAFASPIAHLTLTLPPTLISHGIQDQTVPVGQSDEFVRAAKQAGIPVTSVNSTSSTVVASSTGITYDRHTGGHGLGGSPAALLSFFKTIAVFSKGSP